MAAASQPDVEFMWWSGCPSWDQALSELREAMGELGLDPARVRLLQIEGDEQAVELGFVGSPTIRVDGVDIVDPADTAPGLNCRVYRLRDGRISALPDPDDVREALQAASGAAAR
jgi:hypothetical protein